MSIDSALSTVSSALKGIVNLGLGLVLVFLVVDILFPNTTNIVNNVGGLVASFTNQGLVGLVALLVFLAIFLDD